MKLKILACFFLFLVFKSEKEETVGYKIERAAFFMIAGQSNASGMGDVVKSEIKQFPCFEYDSMLNSLIPLTDPVGQDHLSFESARTGSFIPAFAYTFAEKTGKETYIVQCAKPGSALHKKANVNNWKDWSPSGRLLKNSFKKIGWARSKIANKTDNSQKMKLTAVIWSQGEMDGEAIALGALTNKEYEKALVQLIAMFRNKYGTSLPFIIVQTGGHNARRDYNDGFRIVREVQNKVANSDSNTYIGYDQTKNFASLDWLADPVHYNQEGLNDIGEQLARFIINHNLD